ncbi:MAG: hypothetical protein J6B37_08690 [Clostridia bacterium]|nr:hypothetical protein [Clostridia bacterium]
MEQLNKDYNYIISFISPRLHMYLSKISDSILKDLQEIRLRADRPVVLVTNSGSCFLTTSGKTSFILSSNCVYSYKNEISDTVNKMCDYSMHSHYEDLLNGYLTLPNGSRVGLCGTAVYEKDKVKGVKDFSCINIRIPRNVIGISEKIMNDIFKYGLDDLLIVGAPSSGKTTMLKDIAYQLSSGRLGKFYKVCVVDERKEIFPEKTNLSLIGPNTDVLSGYPKAQGIMMAVRTLSPDVIICDEIGQKSEIDEMLIGMNSGVRFVLSVHASSYDELKRKSIYKSLFMKSSFKNIVFLSGSNNPCVISKIFNFNDEENICSINSDYIDNVSYICSKAN